MLIETKEELVEVAAAAGKSLPDSPVGVGDVAVVSVETMSRGRIFNKIQTEIKKSNYKLLILHT